MEPDVIYFFQYSSEQDATEYVDRIFCKDVENVEIFKPDGIQIKTKYAFRIEIKDKAHLFCIDHAIQVNNWVKSVKRAKKSQEEVFRTLE